MFRAIFFTTLVVVGSAAHAGDKPLYAPVPAWVKPAPPIAKPKDGEDAPIALIFDQQQRLQDGQLWAYMDTATRIASADVLSGAGTVQLQWQPEEGDLTIHRAVIQRDADEIDLLNNPTRFTVLRRESQLEMLEMNGVLTATLAAEGLRIGDVLRITYSVTTTDPALQGGVQTLVPLPAAPARIGFGRARLLWKSATPIMYRTYLPGVEATAKDVGGYREIELPLPLAKPADLPADAPLRVRGLSLLDAGSFADWPAVSKVMAPLYRTDGTIAPGSPLAAEVGRIAKASADPRARAAAALQLVQGEVRYLFQGMNGGNYTPQAPAQTWNLRYGDCKAKTLLLLALLHDLGIKAEAVTAHTELGDLLPKRLPMPAAFDHVLVRATIDDRSLWLDGTAQGARLADLDDAPPFLWVLPLRDTGAALMAVPRKPAGRVDMAVALDIDQRAGLGIPAPYRAVLTVRGPMATQLATAAGQLPAKERGEMLSGMVQSMIGSEAQPIDETITQDAKAGTAVITASGIMMGGWSFAEQRNSRMLDHIVSSLEFSPDRTRPAWHDIPVATRGGGSIEFSTTLRLPMETTGFTLDGDTRLSEIVAGARLQRTATLTDGVVRLVERGDAMGTEIAPGEIGSTRARLALAKTRLVRVMAPENYPPRWQVVQASRRAGRLQVVEAAYAKAIASEPKEMLGYQNRAAFRAGTYDQRGAIADLDRAIAIEPQLDHYLKRSRLYDAIGDYQKALVDAETAFGLDSGALETVRRLADARVRAGKTVEALALLDERIAAGGQDMASYLESKGQVLSYAGRGAEAVAAIDLAVKQKPSNPMLLNARCWSKAINKLALDTALKDCTRSIELGESPAGAFDSRALVYFRLGRIDDALTDVEAALNLSPNQEGSLYLRGVIRRRKGDNAAGDADLAAARLIMPAIDQEYARWGIVP
ncbi:DUF3857 domain-containing protein [Sphingomonas sp. PB4P5]|uniref:DUF3857 domain-containing protein n=1 Tax=Parasphingomonas puruogangriensis TaxID=3096155 RepID=UPI002FCA988F